jgi:Lanthionine-containing peptide SapB precursor RamS
MALLDIQAMEAARDADARNGHGHGSNLSVALCDSAASVLLCL